MAQPADVDHERADSLVAQGDVSTIRAWLAQDDGTAPPALAALVSRIDAVVAGGPRVLNSYARERLQLAPSFDVVGAGRRGAALYDRFVGHVHAGEGDAAVDAFERAQYLRLRHSAAALIRLEAAYAQAAESYAAREYDRADAALEAVAAYIGSPDIAYESVMPALVRLRGQVDEGLRSDERRSRFFSSERRRPTRVMVSFGAAARTKAATGPLALSVEGGVSDSVRVGGFEQGLGVAFEADAFVTVTSALSVGVGASYNALSFSNEGSFDIHALDVSTSSRSAYALARVLFRRRVGLRPYLVGGVGVVEVVRPLSQGGTFVDTGREIRVVPFTLPRSAGLARSTGGAWGWSTSRARGARSP